MKRLLSFFAILVISLQFIAAQDEGISNIIMPGAKLEKIADGFLFTEGPSADTKGNVYFTDQPNDRIMVWEKKKGLSVFMQPAGRSNGMSFDNKGNLWTCADNKDQIWKIGPDKKVEVIVTNYNGKLLNGPNDLWVRPDGGIYFTDPFYKRSWWDHDIMPQDKQCVYYLEPDQKTVIRVADDLVKPNGIVGTPDGKTLFVADIEANKTWSYSINSDGSLSNKRLFCEMGSDGMTIDSEGNLYLTGSGVTIFDKTGTRVGNIRVPESWTANVCFGDKDLKSLYITASKGLYRIRLKVKGTRG
ncbi:MAG: SMP-30/gluconolactonase/LRE family protein [Bacteroidales bacterium]